MKKPEVEEGFLWPAQASFLIIGWKQQEREEACGWREETGARGLQVRGRRAFGWASQQSKE